MDNHKLKVIIDINHPAHVHLFKHLYWKLQKDDHEVIVVASNKDIAFRLLENYQIPYINIGSYGKGLFSKFFKLIWLDLKMLAIVWKTRPDYILGVSTIRGAHAGWFFKRTKVFAFTDTEHAKEQIMLYKNVADKIFTPDCFMDELGKRQVRYKGYQELAYLHPDYFEPDENVLKEFGVSKNENYYVLRFVSWDATHDVGQKGLDNKTKLELVKMLDKKGKVFITSEGSLPKKLKKYQINVSPEKIHHLMYFSQMYIGEGGTMASEAALMGVPSLFVNTLTMGYINNLEQNYGLLVRDYDQNRVLNTVENWLKNKNLKKEWEEKRNLMLKDKIDLNEFVYEKLT